MAKEEITFTIRPDGTVEEETHGIKGARCEEVTRQIEGALGTITHREPTAERYETPQTQTPDELHQRES